MTGQPLDPAAIMSAHEGHLEECNLRMPPADPLWLANPAKRCLPYRLAADLAAAQERVSSVDPLLIEVEDWGKALRDARRPCEHQSNMVESHSVGRSLMAYVQHIRIALHGPPEEFRPDWPMPAPLTDRRCDWKDCPGRPASEPVHEHETGPELHAGCRRLIEEQPDAQTVTFSACECRHLRNRHARSGWCKTCEQICPSSVDHSWREQP